MSRLKKTSGDVVKFPNSYYPQHESIQELIRYKEQIETVASSMNQFYEIEKYIKSIDVSNYYYNEIYGALSEIKKAFNNLESAGIQATDNIDMLIQHLKEMSEDKEERE